LLLACLCGATPTGPGFSNMGAIARLDRTNACTLSSIHGAATCFLDRTWEGSTLRCRVTHNIQESIVVEIRAGVDGPVLFTFNADSANGYYLDQRFQLDVDDDDLEEAELLSGKWAVLIRSSSCDSGALAGVLANTMDVYSHLQGRNQIMNTPSTVEGLAVGRYAMQSRRLDNYLQFDVDNILYSQIVLSTSADAPLHFVYGFDDTNSPVEGSFPLASSRVENQLYHNEHYYQVLTETYPTGEIGGVLHVLDAAPETNFAFIVVEMVEGRQRVRGTALFSLLCDGGMEYMVSHELEDVVSAAVVDANTGEELFSLNGMRSPIIGREQLVRDQVVLLLLDNVELTLVLTTDSVTSTGQLVPAYPFYAYISGSQHVPRQSVFARGSAVFGYDVETRELEYFIYHNMEDVTAIQFYVGGFGANGAAAFTTSSTRQALSGRVILSESQEDSFFREQMYVQITNGVDTIRGQILYSTPHCFESDESHVGLLDVLSRDTDRYYSSSPFFSNPSSSSTVLALSWILMFFVVGAMM